MSGRRTKSDMLAATWFALCAPAGTMPTTAEQAIAAVRARHPLIRAGRWAATFVRDPQGRTEIDCWWVSHVRGERSGRSPRERREWTVDLTSVDCHNAPRRRRHKLRA